MKNLTGKKVAVGVLAAILAAGTAAGGVCQIPYNVLAESIIDSAAKETKGSLKITKTDNKEAPLKGAKFTLYQLMSITPGATAGAFANYALTEDFKNTELKGVKPDALGEYKASDIEALAGKLQEAIAAGPITGTESAATAEDGTTTFTDLALGYYMVVETTTPNGAVAGKPFFISVPMTNGDGTEWVYNVEATPKNEKLSLEKVVGADAKPSNTAKIGDIIPFKVTTSIPTYTDDYFDGDNTPTFIIKDTMDDGLTIKDTVTVSVDGVETTAEGSYTVETVNYTGTDKTKPDLKITFTETFLKANQGKSVVVDYSAVLNENAVSGKAGNGNMAFLTYNNEPATVDEKDKLVNPNDPDPDDRDNPPDGPNDETETYTFKITVIEKTEDGNEGNGEDGNPDVIKTDITYTLLDKNGDPVMNGDDPFTITPDENGEIKFPGLDGGTYYLKETETKDGYTLLTNPIKVVITPGTDGEGNPDGSLKLNIDGTDISKKTPLDKDANTDSYVDDDGDGSAVIIVNKNKGFTLPTTGGMGIVIFLTIGLAGIAGISVVLMRKKRVEE